MFKYWMIPRSPDGEGGGGSGGANGAGSAGGSSDDGHGAGGDKGKVMFTPEQQTVIDQLMGDRGKRGAQAREQELLKELGFENLDKAKEALTEFRKLQDAGKSELEKAQADAKRAADERDAAKREKEEALARANEKLMRAAVIAEAVKTFDDAELDSVWRAIKEDKTLFESIQLKADTDQFEGVAEAVKKIADAHPRWLKTTPFIPQNINSTSGGKSKSATSNELLDEKRHQYAGTI